MNKTLKAALALMIIISLALAVASCGGGNSPKSLAKQSFDLMMETEKLERDGVQYDDPKAAAVRKKAEALKSKVDQLSEADSEIYMAEIMKLAEAAATR